jgi:hypothetical protein
LCQEEKDRPERCVELLRQGLLIVQPFVKERPEIDKAIAEGLERAGREQDLRKRAALLRKTLASIR